MNFDISLIVGIVSIFVSIFAVIYMFMTRSNIVSILDKDQIIFDENLEIKKSCLVESMDCVDEIADKGNNIKFDRVFVNKAKHIYNDLVCLTTDLKIAQEFYNIAVKSGEIQKEQLINYKLLCRKEMGFKTNNKTKKNAMKIEEDNNKIETDLSDSSNSKNSYHFNQITNQFSNSTDTQPNNMKNVVNNMSNSSSNANSNVNAELNKINDFNGLAKLNIDNDGEEDSSKKRGRPAKK